MKLKLSLFLAIVEPEQTIYLCSVTIVNFARIIMKGSLLSKIIIIFSLYNITLTAQEDTFKTISPFKYGASYIGDFVSNQGGGIREGSRYLGMANIMISFDTKAAGLWKGGMFYINAANTHGGTPTSDMIGDFQGITNIEAGNLTYLHELWYKQLIGNFTLTAGLQDLASEFAVSEYSSLFLNGSFGTHSTIADNVPAPIFPLTALGAQLHWNISESFSGKFAVFDGHPDDFENNPYNISWKLTSSDGYFTVSELNYTTELINQLTGIFKIGTYYHNHIVTSDESEHTTVTNNYGVYFVADQLLFEKSNGKKLGFFTQAGISPYKKNKNNFYLGTGINYSGLFKSRISDILGLAVAHAGFRNSSHENETVIEFSYMVQITDNISIQPDFQYIINPAGTDEELPNTLAGIVRMGFNF